MEPGLKKEAGEAEEAGGGADAGHRVLIFAQLKGTLDLVESEVLGPLRISSLRIDGGVDAAERFRRVQRFNADPTIDVMLLTTAVGGARLQGGGREARSRGASVRDPTCHLISLARPSIHRTPYCAGGWPGPQPHCRRHRGVPRTRLEPHGRPAGGHTANTGGSGRTDQLAGAHHRRPSSLIAAAQAMDRAHRLGQRRAVNVYRLLVRGTLEEQIMSLQAFKLDVAATLVNADNASLAAMDTGNLLDAFGQEGAAQPARKQQQQGGGDETAVAAAAAAGGGKAAGLAVALAGGGGEGAEAQYAGEFDLAAFQAKLAGQGQTDGQQQGGGG